MPFADFLQITHYPDVTTVRALQRTLRIL